jgi:hypothetical protein
MAHRRFFLALVLGVVTAACASSSDDDSNVGAGDSEWGTARPLSASSEGKFRSEDFLPLDVHRTQQALGRYLAENLGCSQITLCLKDVTPPKIRFFRSTPGSFELKLTASCRAQFSDFRFHVGPAWDWEDYTDVLVGYTQQGQWIEKDIVARPSGEDSRQASSVVRVDGCDSSPIDRNMPFDIITDPDNLRHF